MCCCRRPLRDRKWGHVTTVIGIRLLVQSTKTRLTHCQHLTPAELRTFKEICLSQNETDTESAKWLTHNGKRLSRREENADEPDDVRKTKRTKVTFEALPPLDYNVNATVCVGDDAVKRENPVPEDWLEVHDMNNEEAVDKAAETTVKDHIENTHPSEPKTELTTLVTLDSVSQNGFCTL